MAANVPMMESGTAAPGINVALRLRRKTKITITTRQTVSTRVNSTSWIEPRIDSEASKATSSFTEGGISARNCGSRDRKSTRLNSSHLGISYAVFCLKKKKH